MNFVNRFKAFYAQPYSASMSAGGWFLMVGFLILCAIGWSMVIGALKRVA